MKINKINISTLSNLKYKILGLLIFIGFNLSAQHYDYNTSFATYTTKGNGYVVDMVFKWRFMDCNYSSKPQINLGIFMNPSLHSSRFYIYEGTQYYLDDLGVTANLKNIRRADVSGEISVGAHQLGTLQMRDVETGTPNCFQYSYNASGKLGFSYEEHKNMIYRLVLSNLKVLDASTRDYNVETIIKRHNKKIADKKLAETHIINGETYYKNEQYQKAIDEYTEAMRLSPEEKPDLENRISSIRKKMFNDSPTEESSTQHYSNSNTYNQNSKSSSSGSTKMTAKENNSSKTQNTTSSSNNETKEISDNDYYQANRDRRAEAEAQQQKAIDDAAYGIVMMGFELAENMTGLNVYLSLSTGVQLLNNSNAFRYGTPGVPVPEKGAGYNEINFCLGTRFFWGPVYWVMEYGIGRHNYSGWVKDSESIYTGSSNIPTLNQWKPYSEGAQMDMFSKSFNGGHSDDETMYRRYRYDESISFFNFSIKTGLGFAVPVSKRVSIGAEVNIALQYNPAFMNNQLSEGVVKWVLPEYRVIVNVGRIGFGIGLANPLYFASPDPSGTESYLMENDIRVSKKLAYSYLNDGKYLYKGRVELLDKDGNPEKRRNYSMLWSVSLIWTFYNDSE